MGAPAAGSSAADRVARTVRRSVEMKDTGLRDAMRSETSDAAEVIPATKLLERVVELERFFSPIAVPQVCFLELARHVEFVSARGAGSRGRVAVIR